MLAQKVNLDGSPMATFKDDTLRLEEGLSFSALDEARSFLHELVGRETITNATYFGLSLPWADQKEGCLITTYPQAWAEHYFARSYHTIDPVISLGMAGILPFDWDQTPQGSQRIRDFFSEAAEFGVGRRGVSVPIRGAVGDRALFSVTSSLTASEWRLFKREALGDLMMVAFQFHQAVIQHKRFGGVPSRPQLAPRELEVLKWAAAGKSIWDTSVILGLSERTVQFYLRNAATKLNATNKTQAVAEALRLSLL